MSAPFQPGEIVDVVIKGVRVVPSALPMRDGRDLVSIRDEHGDCYVMPSQAAITRVAPAEWPPLPGDKWRDGEGRPWFAIDVTDPVCHEEQFVALVNTFGARLTNPYADVVKYGPFTLVHREEQAEADPVEAAEPVETDADVLRSAAEKLRARGRAAFVEMTTCPGGYATPVYAAYLLSVLGETEPRTPVLELAVMMSTTVASTLAEVLDEAADQWTEYAREADAASASVQFASVLDLARVILGEQDGGEK